MKIRTTVLTLVCLTVIVGCSPTRNENDEYQYHITWERKADLPAARRNLKTAAIGEKIYALGGYAQPNEGPVKGHFCYDTVHNRWSVKAEMPTARSNFAVASVNGKLYAIGGDKFLDNGEVYDPSTDAWEAIASMPTARQHINGGAIGGSIHVAGGRVNWSEDDRAALVDRHEVYDIDGDTWKTLPALPGAFENPSLAVVGQTLYLLDGKTRSLLEYDAESRGWKNRKPMPSAHFPMGAAVVQGKIVILDGVRPAEKMARVFVYDPQKDAWGEATPLPAELQLSGFTSVNNKLVVVGGCDSAFVAVPHIFVGQLK